MSYSRFEPQEIECYPDVYSVTKGNTISFSVSVKRKVRKRAIIEVFRLDQIEIDDSLYGNPAENAYHADFRNFIKIKHGSKAYYQRSFSVSSHRFPSDSSENGCRWPVACSWSVPTRIKTGLYFARFSYEGHVAYSIFVVRSKSQGKSANILCQISINTYQAYNAFGGYCLYFPPISLGFKDTVSFERPCQLWDYILYESSILQWLDRNYHVDFCTNVDLHENSKLLNGYDLFISCGHDEYWSSEMRKHIEIFGESGGNVIFLSGNTCYRPIRYLKQNGFQMKRRTLEFGDLGRPEALTTGLNWSAGRWSKDIPKRGLTVRASNHWIFKGTGLKNGDEFGQDVGIIGYETDAAVYDFEGNPISPTPSSFQTLATAYLPDWDDWYGRAATMGVFRRKNSGFVLNVGTTGWGRGLTSDAGTVHQITKNAVDKFTSGSSVV